MSSTPKLCLTFSWRLPAAGPSFSTHDDFCRVVVACSPAKRVLGKTPLCIAPVGAAKSSAPASRLAPLRPDLSGSSGLVWDRRSEAKCWGTRELVLQFCLRPGLPDQPRLPLWHTWARIGHIVVVHGRETDFRLKTSRSLCPTARQSMVLARTAVRSFSAAKGSSAWLHNAPTHTPGSRVTLIRDLRLYFG